MMEISIQEAMIVSELIQQAFLDGFDDEELEELYDRITDFLKSQE